MTFEPQPAGPTFARCALRGARAGPKRTYGDIHIYKYINIYTKNLKFAQLVTELASLATRNATALGSLIWPRAVTRCNLAVSDMYMRDFGKTHQIAYTYCSVGISDLKPLTGTSADQLPHRKSRSLATA